MNADLLERLRQAAVFLSRAVNAKDSVAISDTYAVVTTIVTACYQTPDIVTALAVERIIASEELNRPPSSPKAFKALADRLADIEESARMYAMHRSRPDFQVINFISHAAAQGKIKDGTTFDALRETLNEIRKAIKAELTSPNANENTPRIDCNKGRFLGLILAESRYLREQHENMPYANPRHMEENAGDSVREFQLRLRPDLKDIGLDLLSPSSASPASQ